MKTRFGAACAVVIVIPLASSLALGCGDTNLGAGVQPIWQCADGAASSVLVYVDAAAGELSVLADPALPVTLTSAGFFPLIVTSLEEVRQALSEGSFAVVLVRVETAPSVRALLDREGAPALLPVIDGGTRAEAKAAKAAYGRVVRAPVRARALVDTLSAAASR